MILLVELFIAALLLAGALALASFMWWLLLVLLVLAAAHKAWDWYRVRKYEADVQAGRVAPHSFQRCPECSDRVMPCESCVQAHKAANPA
ncbi:hypothetical protein [Streptomyces sp. NPDC006631]|uniref:hypothetical protein n=1 Tax=Streptomyces sp. NPDC006631 TaxID=3364752 RepID=UPI0036929B8B